MRQTPIKVDPQTVPLDYESQPVGELIPPIEQFKQLLTPLIFLLLGLLFFGAQALFFSRGRSAGAVMSIVLMTAGLQSAVGIYAGCQRGYFELSNSFPTWCAVLKLCACVVFCTGLGGLAPYGSGLMLVFLTRLLMWVFEATASEAIGFLIICGAIQVVVYVGVRAAVH